LIEKSALTSANIFISIIMNSCDLRSLSSCFFAVIFLAVIPVFAQSPPNPNALKQVDSDVVHRDTLWNSYRIEQEIKQFRNQPAGVVISTPQLPPELLDEKSDQKILKINNVIFFPQPATVKSEELHAIAQKYINREKVSIRDLYLMLTEIDSLFDARRVVGRAVLPIQNIENGVVRIQIVEGKIGEKIIEEKRQAIPIIDHYRVKDGLVEEETLFGKYFVKKHFQMQTGNILNLKKLEEDILQFNRKYRTQLLAVLEPGGDTGESNLKLTAVSPQMLSAGYFLDNSGRNTSGKIRNGMFMQTQSVLGLDEMIYFSFDKTDGTEYVSIFADAPITKFGTYAEFSVGYGTPETLYGDFAALKINGMSRRYRPGFRQSLINSKKRKIDLSFAVENYFSETRFDTQTNYGEDLTGYTIGISDIRRFDKFILAGSMSYQTGNAGIKSWNGIAFDKRSQKYHILNSSLTGVWYPNKKWTLVAKLNGQWALSDLAQSRVYQIGGMATIRGVQEGLMSAESGYLLNLEARRLLHQCKQCRLDVFSFFDHGGVFNRVRPAGIKSADYLSSIGVGFSFSLNRYFSFSGGYGEPLWIDESHKAEYLKTLKHGNAYFTLQATF
jgi:hemolysin activation/secretion protein